MWRLSADLLAAPKVLASVLNRRVRASALHSLLRSPQFAYLPERSTADALDIAFSRCHRTRALLQSQVRTMHHTRDGAQHHKCCGGLALSVDMAKAFDRVPWAWLARGLRECQVDEALVGLHTGSHVQECDH